MVIKRLFALLLLLAVSACWQSEEEIYSSDDFFLPAQGELVTINDAFGPLGLYSINNQNQYFPVYTDAEPNSIEQQFRTFEIGFVPIDRMASYREPREGWLEDPTFSRSIFQDDETLLFVTSAELSGEAGQLVFASFISKSTLNICPTLLQEGKGNYENFTELAALRGSDVEHAKKAGIAMLVLAEVTQALQRDELTCDEYNIETHKLSEQTILIDRMKKGDVLRAAEKERRAQAMVQEAKSAAEAHVAQEAQQAANTVDTDETTLEEKKQNLAELDGEIADLMRQSYAISNELNGELWGTVENVGDKYYGVERRFIDNGLLFNSKMLCHNLAGYQSIYVTVTHNSSPSVNASWVMRGDKVPVRIETEYGVTNHNAALRVVDKTQYTNTLALFFADLVPSRLDNQYVLDPPLLARTRRQAEMFGTSVEALTRIGWDLISLESALTSKTIKIYADIRQNGVVRTVMLGDFGMDSEANGLEGFHSACLFEK